MVLSTQTLLLSIGAVGGGGGGAGAAAQAGAMAGAFNWVMKDFMGQLGGGVTATEHQVDAGGQDDEDDACEESVLGLQQDLLDS